MKWRVLFHFLTKTIWFQLPRISRLRWLRKSALERLVVSPIAERCALMMGALRARDLAAAVHSAAVDVARGNFDAVASPHHRRRTEESASEGSRRQRIERTKNLWVEVWVSFWSFSDDSTTLPMNPLPCSMSSIRHRVTSRDASVTNLSM